MVAYDALDANQAQHIARAIRPNRHYIPVVNVDDCGLYVRVYGRMHDQPIRTMRTWAEWLQFKTAYHVA